MAGRVEGAGTPHGLPKISINNMDNIERARI